MLQMKNYDIDGIVSDLKLENLFLPLARGGCKVYGINKGYC